MEPVLDAIVATMIVWLPAMVTFLTELAKRIPQIPTTQKNIKYWAFGFAVVVTIGAYYYTGDLRVENIVQLATHIALNYAAAVGIYETAKNLIKEI